MKFATWLASGCALAALAPAAQAQSSVTLHGVVDAGVLSMSRIAAGGVGYIPTPNTTGRRTSYKDGGLGASNWGMRGREDLGGGNRVMFQMQGNINSATGAAGGPNSSSGQSVFNQSAWVGVGGGFGEVKIGRQVSPMYWAMASTDARGGRYFGSSLTGLVGLNSASGAFIGNNSNAAFGTIYNDNAVIYTSPTFANTTLNLAYAFGNSEQSMRANSQQTATLQYNANGLRLSAIYYNGYGNNLPAATALYSAKLGSAAAGQAAAAAAGFTPEANTNRLVSVGALYNWSAYTVSGAWFRATNPAKVVVPGGSAGLNMWSLGAGWKPQANLNLTAGYYRITDRTNDGHNASQLAVGAEYSLSKRTTLYAQAATVRNRGANMNLSPVYATMVPAGRNVNAYMAGMRHAF